MINEARAQEVVQKAKARLDLALLPSMELSLRREGSSRDWPSCCVLPGIDDDYHCNHDTTPSFFRVSRLRSENRSAKLLSNLRDFNKADEEMAPKYTFFRKYFEIGDEEIKIHKK